MTFSITPAGMGIRVSIHRVILPVVSALRRHITTRIDEHSTSLLTPAMKMGMPYNGVNAAEGRLGT